MSKKGKVGAIVFFLFSIGAVIFALKLIGNIEESRREIRKLTISLEDRNAELVRVREEKVTLREELKGEKELKEEIQRKLGRRIKELQEEVRREREEKVALKKKLEEPLKARVEWEEKHRELQQTIANLRARLEELPPGVEEQVVEILPVELPSVKMEGKVTVVAKPFLSLELNREVVAALKPALSIYRRNELIRKLDTKGIRHVNLVARVALEKSLQGIRENDQVKLSLFPGVAEMFTAPRMEGEVLDVIRPGFLNIDLGREGLENVEPILLVYRDGELFRKIELKDMDSLTIMVEAVEGANIRGIRERDIVKLTR